MICFHSETQLSSNDKDSMKGQIIHSSKTAEGERGGGESARFVIAGLDYTERVNISRTGSYSHIHCD